MQERSLSAVWVLGAAAEAPRLAAHLLSSWPGCWTAALVWPSAWVGNAHMHGKLPAPLQSEGRGNLVVFETCWRALAGMAGAAEGMPAAELAALRAR